MSSLQAYNVKWDTPSREAAGSMPLGNGDVTLNVWVAENGDLVFYIGKTDSWGDNGRLLKVGRVRFHLQPTPFSAAGTFEQTLHLDTATIAIGYGEGDARTDLRVWVDAHHPVIHVEVHSRHPLEAIAAIELWRTEPHVLPAIEVSDVMFDRSKPDHQHAPTVVEPDTLLRNQHRRIGWYHHNKKSVGPALTAQIQGLTEFKRPDPLLHRTFGAVIQAENGERRDDIHLLSPSATTHRFSIFVLTQHPATPEQWLQAMERTIAEIGQTPFARRRAAHERWWQAFWERSWIHVTAEEGMPAAAEAFEVSRAYALQRFVTACAGRGAYPIKFNGSIFTVPYPEKPGDADYRRWGPGYWWQNTRLPYIGMCAAGDFDLLQPLFRMYGRDLLPLCRYRTRRYLGHAGAFIPECMYFWGDIFTETYGWTPFEEREDKLQESRWHKWEWVAGPELVYMMLDYFEYTLDEAFLSAVLPFAHEILTFFDQHYGVDAAGKLVMHPAQALETWWECTNPMPELAGLHAVTERLLALPAHLTTPEQRAFWQALQQKLPALPTREVEGQRMLAPAAVFAEKHNVENPELYAVFPFRRVVVGRPDLELGIAALHHREDRGHFGWRQDDIFMAYLGLAEEARATLVNRVRTRHYDALTDHWDEHGPPRFPGFWGPNYDWTPDQCHGGVLQKVLQSMLLQSDGEQIYLLPAWPRTWDVDFRLHAPYKTVVQGRIRKGTVVHLDVQPAERRKDVVILAGGG